MKPKGKRKTLLLLPVSLSGVLVAFSPARASCVCNDSQPQQPSEAQQSGPDQDPVTTLQLTPEQREQIRAIREQNKDERFATNQRLRQAQLALEESLDSDHPNEALIQQHIRDVADSRAALMRMRAQTELKIRSVLTPEQLTTLRRLQQQAKDRRERRLQNSEENQRRMPPVGRPNRRNGLGPFFPRVRRGFPRKPRP